MSLLALDGLRISEALGVDIDDLIVERGHRTVTVVREGGKVVTMPLAPRRWRRGGGAAAHSAYRRKECVLKLTSL